MPIPRTVARWNRVGLNRVARRVAPRAPGFGVVVHRGRRSGLTRSTPVNVFTAPDGWVVALTYGPRSDWVLNVLADGRCRLVTRGREHVLVDPRVVHDPTRRFVPPGVRRVLRLVRVDDFLVLREAPPPAA